MAIYHCSTKTINRSSGRTAVASSAYRAGEKLEDERTGLTHDFTRKDGVAHSEIISNLDIEINRSELWNLAEKTENRKDARTAREWVIALPDELTADQRKDLAKDFATALVDRYGVIADLAIHEPSKGGSEKIDHRSYADQNNGLQATIHEGTKVTQLRRQGIDTEISRFNDNVKQQNTQQLHQEKQQKESVLQRGLNRVDQGFEQWQKNQESNRLELERQAEMKQQQELDKQRAEQANRKASQDLDQGGMYR